MSRPLVIGSRGSKLALWQAEQAKARLLELHPEIDVRIEIIKTTGDVKTDPLSVIGGKGVDIKKAEIAGKGTYFRVRIPAGTRDEANALCSRYKSAGGSCLVTR